MVGEEPFDLGFKSRFAIMTKHFQGFVGHAVVPFRGVDGSVRSVGVLLDQLRDDELVQCEASDGLSRVRCVFNTVLVADPVHDGTGSQHGISGPGPVVAGLEL